MVMTRRLIRIGLMRIGLIQIGLIRIVETDETEITIRLIRMIMIWIAETNTD